MTGARMIDIAVDTTRSAIIHKLKYDEDLILGRQFICIRRYMEWHKRGGGDRAETDLDNVFYTIPSNTEVSGGKRRQAKTRHSKRKTLSKRKIRKGGADETDADFDTIFGKELEVHTQGGRRHFRKSKKSRKQHTRGRKRRSSKRGGHSWSNVGVDRVRRSLQNGRIVETGRLKDYNIYRGAY